MSLRTVGLVYRKELLETVRDRRTLVVMVILPLVLYPIVGIGITQWVGTHQLEQVGQISRVGVVGPAWHELEETLESDGRIQVQPLDGEEGRVRAGEVDVALLLRPDLDQSVEPDAEETAEIQLIFDETRDRSLQARARVRQALQQLTARLQLERIRRRGLPESMMRPLALSERGLASSKEMGAQVLSGFVPLLVVLMVMLGAFYPAIDLTAGEKERGTLETLLVTPVPRVELIVGKYLVVATVATVTGWLNLGSIGVTFGLGFGPALAAAGVDSQIPWTAVAVTAAVLIPTALFFAALMVAVASLTRTFKEAQNLLTPVYMVCLLPAMIAQLPGLKLTAATALIPIVNVALLTRDLIAGRIALVPTLISLAMLLLCTFAALKLAARIFDSERLLFAPDPSLRRLERRGPRRLPNALQAGVVLMVVMALILLVGQRLQAKDLIAGILITEWGMIGLPVILLIRFGRLDLRGTLLMARSRALVLFGAALAGISAWYLVGTLVELLQQRLLPMPPEMAKAFYRAVVAPERHLALDLFALALSPAICEEMLFRGLLLQSMRRTMNVRTVVVTNGLLFGLFHLSPWRFFPTMVLGMVLTVIVLRSGSIWPGMLFHFLNNATALVVARLSGEPGLTAESAEVNVPLLCAAGAVFLFGFYLATHRGRDGDTMRSGGGDARAGPSDPPDP